MKPLAGKRILITRDATQAGNLKERLEQLGAEVISIPTISICDPPDWQPFDLAVKTIETFSWLVFTSINAVTQTSKRLAFLGYHPESLQLPKIAAVGDQTARQVEAQGWKVDFIPDKFQAENLASGLVSRGVSEEKIWFPRALVARHVLIDELIKTGAEVVVTPVYQNSVPLENRDILREVLTKQDLDWVTFTSSSTVTNFFEILDQKPGSIHLPKLASIGSITSKTIRDLNLEPAFTASPQNLDGLCQGIVDSESV